MTSPSPVRWTTALLAAIVVGALTYLALRLWDSAGRALPRSSWFELVALVLIAATLGVLGSRVRRITRGLEGPRVSPLTAARTFALAQASVVVGGAFAGAHVAWAAILTPEAGGTGAWGGIVREVVLAVVAAVLAFTGLLVQRWCRHDDEPRDDD